MVLQCLASRRNGTGSNPQNLVKQHLGLVENLNTNTKSFQNYGYQCKWRIVFDTSTNGYGSQLLNDILEIDPNLLPETLAVVLRFRLLQHALLALCRSGISAIVIEKKNRLQFTDTSFNEKHPLILNGNHHFSFLLIRHTHAKLHHQGLRTVLSDIRERFWFIRARQAIKKILRFSLPYKLANNRYGQAPEAPLPADRVQCSSPFSVTGLDFAGPLYTKQDPTIQKVYVLLLTCAITRAIHLEHTSDMSVDKFLLAFQRFVNRRGIPHMVYSDNATTFHAANKEFRELSTIFLADKTFQYFALNRVHWKFIAPRAAL
ncbi:hypothetical protein ANN_08768 [Periplaneta americana]|uniref:Integrase catalytic domain-containing protein n=1 Tax=Periplaneta americana TaxID=6978 RepID=A0ABQ8T2D9_PERAM|nr:hypothetical protein ANN_08768 [Periplaneta americana]